MELNLITEKLKLIISQIKEQESLAETLKDDDDIINDIGIDSLEMIEFMLEIEDAFAIELNFDNINIAHLNSIKALGEYLHEQIESI